MKTIKVKARIEFASLPKDYPGLCGVYLPRPIHSKAECDEAFAIAATMAGHKLTKDQDDYLDIVSSMIEDYEDRARPPAPKINGLDSLKHALAANTMNASDLARLLGIHRSHGAQIVRGLRRLTVAHLKILSERFGLPAEAFMN